MPVGDPGELEWAKEPDALKESWKARVGTHEVPECPLTEATSLCEIKRESLAGSTPPVPHPKTS